MIVVQVAARSGGVSPFAAFINAMTWVGEYRYGTIFVTRCGSRSSGGTSVAESRIFKWRAKIRATPSLRLR